MAATVAFACDGSEDAERAIAVAGELLGAHRAVIVIARLLRCRRSRAQASAGPCTALEQAQQREADPVCAEGVAAAERAGFEAEAVAAAADSIAGVWGRRDRRRLRHGGRPRGSRSRRSASRRGKPAPSTRLRSSRGVGIEGTTGFSSEWLTTFVCAGPPTPRHPQPTRKRTRRTMSELPDSALDVQPTPGGAPPPAQRRHQRSPRSATPTRSRGSPRTSFARRRSRRRQGRSFMSTSATRTRRSRPETWRCSAPLGASALRARVSRLRPVRAGAPRGQDVGDRAPVPEPSASAAEPHRPVASRAVRVRARWRRCAWR